jgi:hypothetical protein
MAPPCSGDVVLLDTMVVADLIEPYPVFHPMVVAFLKRVDAGNVRGGDIDHSFC